MKVATWNVNSIRARLERVVPWLEATRPDVLLIQESKVTDEQFPRAEIDALGYQLAVHGQRTYNGVAVLARSPIEVVSRGFGDGGDDSEARFLDARVEGVRFLCAYVPNGKEVGSPHWEKKLAWYGRLRAYLDARCATSEPIVLGGDMNVAPEAADVANPDAWVSSVLFHPQAREALARVVGWGLADALRLKHPEPGLYSWWDYRMLAFPKNDGLRIDHLFVTPSLVPRVSESSIDRNARKGKQPSDHAPVLLTLT